MENFGTAVVYIIMACAVVGAVVSIINDKHPVGKQFLEGFNCLGTIFIPIAAIMAATPFIAGFIKSVFGPLCEIVGADAAMAVTIILPVDIGGYQLADMLAQTRENWIISMITGYMMGSTLLFNIPVGLKMISKERHKKMAMGFLAGILAIPIGVFISCVMIIFTNPVIRSEVTTMDTATPYKLAMTMGVLMKNMIPLIVICIILAICLIFIPKKMIKLFLILSKIMDAAFKIIALCAVIEYNTRFFSEIIGHWGFNPIMADDVDIFRALEVCGAFAFMLCGAFPMVTMIQMYLKKPVEKIGKLIGISSDGAVAMLASMANIVAMFNMSKRLNDKELVKCTAFAVCAAFMLGDQLAFTANFQPSLMLHIMTGRFLGGVVAVIFAGILTRRKQ